MYGKCDMVGFSMKTLVSDLVECYVTSEMTALESAELKAKSRYPILDALRFALAFWVTTDHLGAFPLFAGANLNATIVRILSHGWSSVFWGVPAVICFFAISGFCIHLPYYHTGALPIGRYYVRRYVRILLPL